MGGLRMDANIAIAQARGLRRVAADLDRVLDVIADALERKTRFLDARSACWGFAVRQPSARMAGELGLTS